MANNRSGYTAADYRDYSDNLFEEVEDLLSQGLSVASIACILRYDVHYLRKKLKERGYQCKVVYEWTTPTGKVIKVTNK